MYMVIASGDQFRGCGDEDFFQSVVAAESVDLVAVCCDEVVWVGVFVGFVRRVHLLELVWPGLLFHERECCGVGEVRAKVDEEVYALVLVVALVWEVGEFLFKVCR